VVVEEGMIMVLKTGHLRPFGSMERLRYVDYTVGGIVGCRSETSCWIKGIDGGDYLAAGIERYGSGASMGHWISSGQIQRLLDRGDEQELMGRYGGWAISGICLHHY